MAQVHGGKLVSKGAQAPRHDAPLHSTFTVRAGIPMIAGSDFRKGAISV